MDKIKKRKHQILARLNREYKISQSKLQQSGLPQATKSSSFKSLEDTRSDYIEKLKNRIKQLEQTSAAPQAPYKTETNHDRKQIPELKPIQRISSAKITPIKNIKNSMNAEPEIDHNMKLIECKSCNRKFRAERIELHQNTCRKLQKSRPVFDEAKMRIKGTDLETFTKAPSKPIKVKSKSSKS